MITCKLLTTLYGRDTRPAQWLNIAIAGLWLLMFALRWFCVDAFAIPEPIIESIPILYATFGGALIFTLFNFLTVGRVHQRTKAFSFALGALANAIITSGYITAYPPLDMMLFFSLALSVWFSGAGFYVTKCEGIDGANSRAV